MRRRRRGYGVRRISKRLWRGHGCGASGRRMRCCSPLNCFIVRSTITQQSPNNRRELASLAGLAPVPFARGRYRPRSGHPHVRQRDGAQASGPDGAGRSGALAAPSTPECLVAMASRVCECAGWSVPHARDRCLLIGSGPRKRLIALWRSATLGIVPTGAIRSTGMRRVKDTVNTQATGRGGLRTPGWMCDRLEPWFVFTPGHRSFRWVPSLQKDTNIAETRMGHRGHAAKTHLVNRTG